MRVYLSARALLAHHRKYPPALEDQVRMALFNLGFTVGQVANSLRTADCRGERGCPSLCPVANYLRRKFPGYPVTVYAEEAAVGDVSVDLPWAVAAFVNGFDERGCLGLETD